MNNQISTVPQVIPQVSYQSPQAPTQPMTESPFVDSGFAVLVFSPEDDPIACNKFREDKGKIILVILIRAMLLVHGEILQVDMQELLNATTDCQGEILVHVPERALIDKTFTKKVAVTPMNNVKKVRLAETHHSPQATLKPLAIGLQKAKQIQDFGPTENTSPVSAAEIHAVEKERKWQEPILLMANSSQMEQLRRYPWNQQLSLNEQLTFQANEIYAKDEKLKRYRRIGMKAVKEKEQCRKQFSKTHNFKGVPHLLTGDYTPKPQEEIDDSLYVYGKKGPQNPRISDSADNSTDHSTCQSNDNEGSFGNPSKHSSESKSESISVPNEMSTSKSVTTNEKVVSESKEVEPSCVTYVKTPRKQMKNQETHEVKRKNWNEIWEEN
ncbi:hypothetical protein Tco_0715130 [Tanacetum coccineum]